MHVLVCEDDKITQAVLWMFIRSMSCTSSVVGNGQEALDYLASPSPSCPPPDLILMETAMPVMDGLTAARIIRTQPLFSTNARLRLTPIVALGFANRWEQCAKAGMNDLILKPFTKSDLRQLLLKWSRREVLPVNNSRMGSVPAWGPYPLRAYRGPRSLL